MKIKSTFFLPFIVALAACGGGSSNDSPTMEVEKLSQTAVPEKKEQTGNVPGKSYNSLVERESALLTEYYTFPTETERKLKAKEITMPVTGRASYNGAVAFGGKRTVVGAGTNAVAISEPDLIARINLDANFANKVVSGEVGGFRNQKNIYVPGRFKLEAAAIDGSGFKNEDTDKVTGKFTFNGVQRELQGGQFTGAFIGDAAQGVVGGIEVFAGNGSGGRLTRTGTFIAEQQ